MLTGRRLKMKNGSGKQTKRC